MDAEKTAALKPAIIKAISTVFDPEIPVNIYELGLIYDVLVDAQGVAGVRMTLTAPGCPVAQSLPVDVANKVKSVEGVTDAKVDIVWEPAVDEGPDVGRGEAAVGDVVRSYQLPATSCQPAMLEAGAWKLEAGSWKLC